MSKSSILICLFRRDLRVADQPIIHEIARLSKQSQAPFTHVLPLYVFPAEQIEISGFLAPGNHQSPYPEARSKVGGFWRCGRLRAKFIGESVWDLKQDLKSVGSDLIIRVGSVKDAVQAILDGYKDRRDHEVVGTWMTAEDAWEEKREEKQVKQLMDKNDLEFKLWADEKYYIDEYACVTDHHGSALTECLVEIFHSRMQRTCRTFSRPSGKRSNLCVMHQENSCHGRKG